MLVSIDDVDVDAAEKAKKDALAMMEKYKDAKDKVDMEKFIEAEDMLLKSVAKLKLSEIK
jgi:F0F1-type ATP synthase epsilon subunit